MSNSWSGLIFENFYITDGRYTGMDLPGLPFKRGDVIPPHKYAWAMQVHTEACENLRNHAERVSA